MSYYPKEELILTTFNALILEEQDDSRIATTVKSISTDSLSTGDVLLKVAYSSVNYKDALATQKKSGVIHNYPIIPGIDLVGTIVEPGDSQYRTGETVIVTGYGLGVAHSGGYADYARVPSDWLTALPNGLTEKESMALGTAGLTAALSVNAIERQGLRQKPNSRILVTGASGGVGSLAIGILVKLGYTNITALTRKSETAHDYFKQLGVTTVLSAQEFNAKPAKPLMAQNFDYVIDTVGGSQLEHILPQISYGGSISLCGNAGGISFNSTVLPYILRGVNLLGIDSVNISSEKRLYIWNRLGTDMKPDNLSQYIKSELTLNDLPEAFSDLLEGRMTGRYLVLLNS